MADELSREALEEVVRLRRRGLISDRCANAGTCKCPEHSGGLARFAPDLAKYLDALEAAQPTRLRIVTMGPPERPGCTEELTCPCERCVGERRARVAQGAGRSQLRVRPMSERHRRAA